jgi:hypothetical protein
MSSLLGCRTVFYVMFFTATSTADIASSRLSTPRIPNGVLGGAVSQEVAWLLAAARSISSNRYGERKRASLQILQT